jgi:hypothetical protein
MPVTMAQIDVAREEATWALEKVRARRAGLRDNPLMTLAEEEGFLARAREAVEDLLGEWTEQQRCRWGMTEPVRAFDTVSAMTGTGAMDQRCAIPEEHTHCRLCGMVFGDIRRDREAMRVFALHFAVHGTEAEVVRVTFGCPAECPHCGADFRTTEAKTSGIPKCGACGAPLTLIDAPELTIRTDLTAEEREALMVRMRERLDRGDLVSADHGERLSDRAERLEVNGARPGAIRGG